MNRYYNTEDPFLNNSELDRMARDLNNNKKKLNKFVPKQSKIHELNECVGIECLMDPSYARFAPSSLGANFSQYSTGDFTSGFPTPMENSITSKINHKIGHKTNRKTNRKNNNDLFNSNYSNYSDNSFGSSVNTNSVNDKHKIVIKNNKGTKISDLQKNISNANKKENDFTSIITINTNSSDSENEKSMSDSVFTDSDYNSNNNDNNENKNINFSTSDDNSNINSETNSYFSSANSDINSDMTSNTTSNMNVYSSVNSDTNIENNSVFKNKTLKSILKKKKNVKIYDSEYSDQAESLISDVSSNYSSLPPKLKNQFKMKSQHLKNYNNNSDQDVLEHTSNCNQCKHLLFELLQSINGGNNSKQIQSNKTTELCTNQENIKNEIQSSEIFGIKMSEIKDLLILLMIGIIIIIVADVFIRK